jgi:hypothetical protein
MSTVETLEQKPKKFSIPADTQEKPAWKIEDRLFAFSFCVEGDEETGTWLALSTHHIGQYQCSINKENPSRNWLTLETPIGMIIFEGPKVYELFSDLRKGRADEIQADKKAILRIGIAEKTENPTGEQKPKQKQKTEPGNK